MRLAILFSGGKDSTRVVHWCLENGYDVRYLVSIIPRRSDSWMYHFPNIHLTEVSAEAIGIPLITRESSAIKEKEVEDMKKVLENLDIDGVACGGIASNYQRKRIERVCNELKLGCLVPFWHTDPEKFMKETIDLGFDVRIVGVYSDGFDESWLGRKLDYDTLDELLKLSKKYGVNLVGEGGEYETLVINGPIFKKKIEILESEKVWDKKTQSGYLRVKKTKLVSKH